MTRRKSQSSNKQKVAISILLTLAGGVFIFITLINLRYIFAGEENILLLYKIRQDNKRMSQVIERLEKENEEMRSYINSLRNDIQLIEEEARRKLNLVKEGEILYNILSGENRTKDSENSRP